MKTKDEALKMALEALEINHSSIYGTSLTARAIKACEEALAQPERKWVRLTNDEIKEYLLQPVERDLLSFARFIEARLKEKNT